MNVSSVGRQYLHAAACVAAVAVLRLVLEPLLQGRSPLILFILAVIATGARYGLGPGLFAVAASLAVGTIGFVAPRAGPAGLGLDEIANMLVFVATSLGVLVIAHRLTRARRAAAAAIAELRASEARYRATVDSAVDAIVVMDESGRIAFANPATARLFGHDPGALIGRNVALLMNAQDAAAHDGYLDAYRDTGQRRIIGTDREVVGRRSDGTVLPLDVAIGEWSDAEGRRFFSGILRDLSERRRAEAELRDSQERLLRLSRLSAMGAMASTIAHELNQPLTAATNYLAAARAFAGAGRHGPQVDDALTRALGELKRAGEIISKARRFAVSGQVVRAPTPLAEIVAASWQQSQNARAALAAARLELDIAPDAEHVAVDRLQIEQVFVNLLRNALEALAGLPDPRVAIAARRADALVEIRVADNGPGFGPDRGARLFQPFATTKPGGTGLGLPICRTIVEAHGGSIRAEPDGPGASFLLTLPAHTQDDGAGAEPACLPRASEL